MSDTRQGLSGPDLTRGDELSTVPDGTMLLGHARGITGALVRRSYKLFVAASICTQDGEPVVVRLLVDGTDSVLLASCAPACAPVSPSAVWA